MRHDCPLMSAKESMWFAGMMTKGRLPTEISRYLTTMNHIGTDIFLAVVQNLFPDSLAFSHLISHHSQQAVPATQQ